MDIAAFPALNGCFCNTNSSSHLFQGELQALPTLFQFFTFVHCEITCLYFTIYNFFESINTQTKETLKYLQKLSFTY